MRGDFLNSQKQSLDDEEMRRWEDEKTRTENMRT